MTKWIFLLLVLSMVNVQAQTAFEILNGNQATHYMNYIQKDLDSAARWNIFSLNRFTSYYTLPNLSNMSQELQLTYQFNPWLGLSAGGGYYNNIFLPTIGLSLSYMNQSQDFFLQLYPTLTVLKNTVFPTLFGLIGYNPMFNEYWGISTQTIFSVEGQNSQWLIRVGANYKSRWQFGIGSDVNIQSTVPKLTNNYGLFVRFNML